jgi:hypothetical protein
MKTPVIIRWSAITRLLQGAAVGAVTTLIAGSYWGGWITDGSARDMAQRSATAAVVSALSPICVDNFQRSPAAVNNMAEFKKISSYQQASFIEKSGWATLPGNGSANPAVARVCAEMLSALK